MSYLSSRAARPLHGELTIQGSKNSVLPVLAATILARDVCRIENCPRLRDVDASRLHFAPPRLPRAARRHSAGGGHCADGALRHS